jgi:signal transduction histidine kinase
MSHEMRTPMHAILNYSAMGIKKLAASDDENLKRYIKNIHTSGERLLTLVNNLLDLGKLESRKTELVIQNGDLHQAMDASITELDPLLSEKGLQIKVTGKEIAAAAPAPHDRNFMVQVFINLLSNAIKFSTEESTIKVEYAHAGSALLCSISNQGKSIPEEEKESIFDAFIQSSATKNGAGGTGLGLAISREIVNRHHGRIWAENLPGWTVFHVQIPLDQPSGTGTEKNMGA